MKFEPENIRHDGYKLTDKVRSEPGLTSLIIDVRNCSLTIEVERVIG